ncbi:MAG TPA: Dabb family protein [Pyrinomonadaceae bacterium]|nr:Dabb family protein [Pyrinomonadaceae bacterium]
MLTHIVIWKYRADAGAELRQEHAAMLRALPEFIPEVQTLSVGFDVLRLPRSYDLGLVAVFRDRAGLEAYNVHPRHVAVVELGRAISEHVASVDFEDEGA